MGPEEAKGGTKILLIGNCYRARQLLSDFESAINQMMMTMASDFEFDDYSICDPDCLILVLDQSKIREKGTFKKH